MAENCIGQKQLNTSKGSALDRQAEKCSRVVWLEAKFNNIFHRVE